MLRPLAAADLPAALALLCEGFPERGPAFWHQGLARLQRWGGNAAACFPIGMGMFDEGHLVGVALTPASLRRQADGSLATLVNISSWTVAPAHRWRSVLMMRRLLADRRHSYIDLTPTPTVRQMLPHFGMQPVNQATAIWLLPALAVQSPVEAGEARLRPLAEDEPPPPVGPLPELVHAHRALACVPLLLQHAAGDDLLVYRRTRLRGLPAAQLVYVHSHRVLARHRPLLARHLLAQGIGLVQSDSREPGPAPRRAGWHTVYRPHGVWFARGGDFSDRTDFLGSERCLLGV